MKATALIAQSLDLTHGVIKQIVDDLSDDDLFFRPASEANHIAWQLGHLISAENGMVSPIEGADMPPLSEEFRKAHSSENAKSTDRAGFLTKAEYLKMYDAQRVATKKLLEKLSDDDLGKSGPEEFREYFPQVGSVLLMQGTHAMMHMGQFSVVRRALGKPVVF